MLSVIKTLSKMMDKKLLPLTLGGLGIGIEREIRHKSAGLKTNSLVSLGSEEQEVTHKLRNRSKIRILFMESPKLRLKIFIFEEFKGITT